MIKPKQNHIKDKTLDSNHKLWCKLELQRARFGASLSFKELDSVQTQASMSFWVKFWDQFDKGLWVCDWCGRGSSGATTAMAGDCGGVGLVAWPLPVKHDPLSLSLSLIWWSVGARLWILEFGLLVICGFLILVCWRGGGDFAMDFGFWFCYGFWVLILLWILLWILAEWRD